MEEIEKIINYKFNDSNILTVAFTHSSLAHEQKIPSNERLEFLGDSVLNMIVSRHLYDNNKDTEGAMTDKRKAIVSRDPLANAVDRLDIAKFLRLGSNTKEISMNMKADLYEAIVAAICVDGGIDAAAEFIFRTLIY